MEGKITIKDIAKLTGFSKSTISRYLNNGYVSAEKAERIQSVIAKTGFQSNFFAARLKTKHSKLVGIILPRMDSVSVGKFLSGVTHVLEPDDYQGLILSSNLKLEKETANISKLLQQGVDGIIVDSLGITKEHLRLVKEAGVPVIFTGQSHPDLLCIKVDDYRAGAMMGNYLRKKGYRHAVFAGVAEQDHAVGVERKQGFVEAFTLKSPKSKVDFVETGFSFSSAYDKGPDIVAAGPEVVVCATDNIALGVLRYLREQEIQVPETMGIAGFGGYEVGAVAYPALTTVAFDYALVGMRTAQAILTLLEGKPISDLGPVPMFFMERESVKPQKLKEKGRR